jgi:Fic family protein
MSKLLRKVWPGSFESGLPRADRRGCEYDAYLPDFLAGKDFRFEADVVADITEAELAIARLNESGRALQSTEALARLLLRAESVASSKIEGLEVGGRRLLRAEAARELGEKGQDITAEEVLGNVEAMRWATEHLASAKTVTVDGLLEVHRKLLAGTRLEGYGGVVREKQNWIGGSSFNPCSAAFVPPPREEVETLLVDLCEFCNFDTLPTVAQAAIAHAQFETIHPFVDGNGRTGRALIHVVLKRRGLAPRVLPPISLVLATWSSSYIDALTRTRYLGPPESAEAEDSANQWVALFASAARRAVEDASMFEEAIERIQHDWRQAVGKVRRNSGVDLLIERLPGVPIVTVQGAANLIGRTYQAANEAVDRLLDAGVLRQVKVGRRNRAFEASDVITAFTDLERQLASPEGDTLVSPPNRAVPRR